MPEDELQVVDETGETVDAVSGNPRTRHEWLHSLSMDDLPDDFSPVEKLILLTALQNLPEQYSKLESLANQRLRDAGYETVSYNKVYRTVKETFEVQTDSQKTMSQTEEQDPKEVYDELTDKQRAVINEYIRDDEQNMSELAEAAGVDPSYPRQVIDKFGWIADELTNVDVKPVGDADNLTDEDAASSEPTSRNDPTPTDEKSYDDLTSLQQQIIDEIVENPNKSYKEIAADVGCDVTYPGTIAKNFEHLINERRGETEDDSGVQTITVGDVEYQVPSDLASAFNDLTEKQQKVIAELVKEDDPTDPDRNRDDLGDAAGVHETYVTEVSKKYGDIAASLKSEGLRLETAEPPEAAEDEGDTTTEDTESQVEWQEVPDEGEDREADADESPPVDDQPFEAQFEAAVDAGDISQLTVREIRNGINSITDADLIQRAREQDDRKTAQSAYEDRLSNLEEEVEPEAEEEVEPEGEEEVEPESETEEEVEPEVESEPTADRPARGGVPVEELEDMRERVDMLHRTATAELEDSDDKAPAARAKSLTEEFERMLDDAIAQYSGTQTETEEPNPPTA